MSAPVKPKRKYTPRVRRNLTEAYGVTAYYPPEQAQVIAEKRTAGMVTAFVMRGNQVRDLATLARSCYLQGVHDGADALFKAGYKIVPIAESKNL